MFSNAPFSTFQPQNTMSNRPELTRPEQSGSSDKTRGPGLPPSAPQRNLFSYPQIRKLALLTGLLILCFAKPLYDLIRFAVHSDLFSHVLLIPFISAYLVWLKKESLRPGAPASRGAAFGLAAAGLAALIGYWLAARSGIVGGRQDYLTWTMFAMVLFFIGACVWCLDSATLSAVAFPLGFLFFSVPFPHFMVEAIETFLQYTSALCAHLFFTLSGMSFIRDGLVFQLPGIQLEVAPECSGIHSTLVLFISSLVAGQLFLRSFTARTLLALAVIPLGILRNAFRIWTIGELCVHISPDMIDSPIHRRGGPFFFALSLIPLALFLIWLRKRSPK
jgi:exosortase C (VPDSG-CTERM-specific)